ncbi:uncharacterized protein P174DRAFT_435997 [Aspergillus novofumigatus IBT 16806]|uniref:Uncharacterized protein n=1 Tax=Aspergillus novofumigatus (strain IBT 16806) TaxID=1392255 RepID=A0A2I1BU02_ASPN1|nr:uncharacterized protein P174DRAFT_435997 [Aspergillus novofumigatus IBT 16806]PKX88836.1 hypothetical protein P174DRAFT_435997 [Aspergillus novofumigatus IBT 16806]
MPSERQKQQRANILSKLRNEPASTNLQAYFERLKKGCLTWDIETFIEGANTFAKLCGPARAKYYDNPLKGLRSANSLTKLWDETYPEEPITLWDRDIRHQCPASWSNGLEGLWMYTAWPGHVHPDFAPKDFGTLAEEAKEFANHTLNAEDWDDGWIEFHVQFSNLSLSPFMWVDFDQGTVTSISKILD